MGGFAVTFATMVAGDQSKLLHPMKRIHPFGWETTHPLMSQMQLLPPSLSSNLLGHIIDVTNTFSKQDVFKWTNVSRLKAAIFSDATRSRCFQRRPDITTCSGRHSSSTTGRFSRPHQHTAVLLSGVPPHYSSQ